MMFPRAFRHESTLKRSHRDRDERVESINSETNPLGRKNSDGYLALFVGKQNPLGIYSRRYGFALVSVPRIDRSEDCTPAKISHHGPYHASSVRPTDFTTDRLFPHARQHPLCGGYGS